MNGCFHGVQSRKLSLLIVGIYSGSVLGYFVLMACTPAESVRNSLSVGQHHQNQNATLYLTSKPITAMMTLYTKATRMCETLHLTPIASPRVRIPLQRFTGSAPAHVHVSPFDYYRTEFYKVLDVADMQFRERFEQEGMQMLRHLDQVLLTGKIHGVVQ